MIYSELIILDSNTIRIKNRTNNLIILKRMISNGISDLIIDISE